MLNSNGQRELAYIVKIDSVEPIPGRDRVECCRVGGWSIMTKLNQFKPGDLGIYFEIDSQVPAKEPFLFLEGKHYKIKTQKYKTPSGQFWSQGLLMGAEDFGWYMNDAKTAIVESDAKDDSGYHAVDDESRFLTKKLEVTYAVAEDNVRKANSVDKYKKMAQRNGKLFSHQPFRWLMKRTWGQKLLFVFFGKKRDQKTAWPEWVAKTDEERVQNMPWILQNKDEWIVSEKIDGSSTTFTMKRHKIRKHKYDFYVCSRNVVFDKPDKKCFYDTNIYLEMADKYNVEKVLRNFLNKNPQYEWVTLQGETYGKDVQRRDYSLDGRDFAGFNFITPTGRWNSVVAKNLMENYGIPWVPILETDYYLPNTVDEILDKVEGLSDIDWKMREGCVFRSQDGSLSFKGVSNNYLIKYHG